MIIPSFLSKIFLGFKSKSYRPFPEKLLSECEVALNQIEEKEYTSILKNAGIDNVLKIGIAFFGKEFEVKFERE